MRDPLFPSLARHLPSLATPLVCLTLAGLAACGQQPPLKTNSPSGSSPAVSASANPSAQAGTAPRTMRLTFEVDSDLMKTFSVKAGTIAQCAEALTDIKTVLKLPTTLAPETQLQYQSLGISVDNSSGRSVLTFANSLVQSSDKLTTAYDFTGLPTGVITGKITFKNALTQELGSLSFTATITSNGGSSVTIQLKSNNTESAIPTCPELAATISGATMTSTTGNVVAYVPPSPNPFGSPTPTPSASGTPLPSLPPGSTPAPLATPSAAAALPQITEMSATTGSPLDTLILTGLGFTNARTVRFGSVPAYSFSVDSDTQITAIVPTGFTSELVTVGNSKGSVDSPDTYTLVPIARAPQITYVKQGGTGDGSSWSSAAGNLAQEMYAAIDGDQIWIAEGKYKPTSDGDRTVSFLLRTGVSIYGGFAGNESSINERNIDNHQTILTGDLAGDDDYYDDSIADLAENSLHVVKSPLGTTNALLDGVTIQGGNANSYSPHDRGGGLTLEPSAITLNKLQIIENHALANGAGMFHGQGSSAVMSNVSFNSNIAGQSGGGMFTAQGSLPDFTNVTFGFNEARSGGGLYIDGVSPTMQQMTFLSNKASLFGGGMYNRKQAGPLIIQANFEKNHASNGGAMYNIDGASPDINLATFKENTADNGGGVYSYNEAAPIISTSQFIANSAVFVGGGMYNYKYTGLAPQISNTVFAKNFAANGGGMANRSGAAPRLVNVVFSKNSASAAGGGVYNYNRGNPQLRNCTLANNSAPSGAEIYAGGISNPVLNSSIVWNDANSGGGILIQSQSTLGAQNSTVKNLSGITVTGFGNIEFDPIFVNPTVPEGPDGAYMTSDDGLRLSHNSLSLNYGISAGAPLVDILGNPRSSPPDQGAYEGDFDKVTAPIQSSDDTEGDGLVANVGDKVTVAYIGYLADGTVFDSSFQEGGASITFILGAGQVISGWDQGIPGMKVNGVRTLIIPPEYAYGQNAVGQIPPNSTLTFEVHMISVLPAGSF